MTDLVASSSRFESKSENCSYNDSGILEDEDMDESPVSNGSCSFSQRSSTDDRNSGDHVNANFLNNVFMKGIEFPSKSDQKIPQLLGTRHQICVKKRTVLVTRLDGISLSTGSSISLYKCHLCGKLLNQLSELQVHLSVHFERRMTVYQCRLCESSFPFKTKLIRHLEVQHKMALPIQVEIPEAAFMNETRSTPNAIDNNVDPEPSAPELKKFGSVEEEKTCSTPDDGIDNEQYTSIDTNENKIYSPEGADDVPVLQDESVSAKSEYINVVPMHDENGHVDDEENAGCLGQEENSNVKSFICQTCDYECRNRRSLYQHIIRHHTHLKNHNLASRKRLFSKGSSNSPKSAAADQCSIEKPDQQIVVDPTQNEENFASSSTPTVVENVTESIVEVDESAMNPSSPHLEFETKSESNAEPEAENLHVNLHELETCTADENIQPNDQQSKDDTKLDSDEQYETEIRSAPIKSIMNSQQFKAKRRFLSAVSSTKSADQNDAKPQLGSLANSLSISPLAITPPIMSHMSEAASKGLPPGFNPNEISPLLGGFLPLPLISLFLSQSALASSTLLGSALPNSQYPFASAKPAHSSQNGSTTEPASCSWDQSMQYLNSATKVPKSEASEEQLTGQGKQVDNNVLDWRTMVQDRMKGLMWSTGSKNSSLSKTQSR